MATYVGVRGLTRRGVRIGDKTVTSQATTVVDLDNGRVRRDISKHSALGAVVVVAANNAFQNPGDGSVTTLPTNDNVQS